MAWERVVYESFADLDAQAAAWTELARSSPFLQPAWLRAWWRHYGFNDDRPRPGHELYAVCIKHDGAVVGFAPWYKAHTIGEGTVLRWLGSGEVCGDYLTIPTNPADRDEVIAALSDQLIDDEQWDLLELNGVASDDLTVSGLVTALAARGCAVEATTDCSAWRIDLRGGWDAYLAGLSKSYRRATRRRSEAIDAGEFTVEIAKTPAEYDAAWVTLVDLHTRRRNALGDAGCFASKRFLEFHTEYQRTVRETGGVESIVVRHQGRPISAEYLLRTGQGTFAYQGGIDPGALELSPGHFGMIAGLRRACSRGDAFVDLLRGDEPYKAFWNAKPCPLTTWRIVPDRTLPRLRSRVRHAGTALKRWVKATWRDATTSGAETR